MRIGMALPAGTLTSTNAGGGGGAGAAGAAATAGAAGEADAAGEPGTAELGAADPDAEEPGAADPPEAEPPLAGCDPPGAGGAPGAFEVAGCEAGALSAAGGLLLQPLVKSKVVPRVRPRARVARMDGAAEWEVELLSAGLTDVFLVMGRILFVHGIL
jgi:hypothetical protein